MHVHKSLILGIASCAWVLLLSLGAGAITGAPSDSVSTVALLSASTVAMGEHARLDVTVEWTGAADQYIVAWPEPPVLDGLHIVGSGQSTKSWIELGAHRTRQTFSWVLSPERTGIAHVGITETLLRATITGESTRISTAPLTLNVVSEHEHTLWKLVLVGVIALGAVVAIAVGLRTRARKRSVLRQEHAYEQVRALEDMLQGITTARDSADSTAFYTEVFSALRMIVALNFAVHTDGMSADDLLDVIRNATIDENERRVYVELLQGLDEKRYTAGQTAADPIRMKYNEMLLRLMVVMIRRERNVE